MRFPQVGIRALIAVISLLFCYSLISYILQMEPNDKNRDVVMVILGSVNILIAGITAYYFSGSHTSSPPKTKNKEEKDDTNA